MNHIVTDVEPVAKAPTPAQITCAVILKKKPINQARAIKARNCCTRSGDAAALETEAQ